MLPVGISLQRQQLRLDLGNELRALFAFSNVKQFLDNVVAKLVFHHRQQWRRAIRVDFHDLIDNTLTIVEASECNAFLDNVGRKLML